MNKLQHLIETRPLTIEAITTSLAQIILTPPPSSSQSTFNISQTSVKLSKPHALLLAKYPSVQVTRTRSDFFSADGSLRSDLSNSLLNVESTASSVIDASIGGGEDDISVVSTEATELESSAFLPGQGGRNRTVYLGVGTNLGNRVGNISKALREVELLDIDGGKTRVVDTSFLYESEAMYVKEQNNFLNAVIKVRPFVIFALFIPLPPC